jgi:hypothetical protein
MYTNGTSTQMEIYSLNPEINNQACSLQEELKLVSAHQVYGDKWIQMINRFPGKYSRPYI